MTDVWHLDLSENRVVQKCLIIQPFYAVWCLHGFGQLQIHHIVSIWIATVSHDISHDISRPKSHNKMPPKILRRRLQIKGAMSRMRPDPKVEAQVWNHQNSLEDCQIMLGLRSFTSVRWTYVSIAGFWSHMISQTLGFWTKQAAW